MIGAKIDYERINNREMFAEIQLKDDKIENRRSTLHSPSLQCSYV